MVDPITGTLIVTSFALAPATRLPESASLISNRGARAEYFMECSEYHYELSGLPVWPVPGTPHDELKAALMARFNDVEELEEVVRLMEDSHAFSRLLLDAPVAISDLLGFRASLELEHYKDVEDDFERVYLVVNTDIEDAKDRLAARKKLINEWLYGVAKDHSHKLALRVA